MSDLAIILIAAGLSMDAFAVSVADGILLKEAKVKNALKIGGYFGSFQALMPLLGWCLGIRLSDYMTKIDHWIALVLLCFIGGKMIYGTVKNNSREEENEERETEADDNDEKILENKALLLLAVATSIDAMAAGISFAFLKVSIIKAASIIGIITFGLSFAGVLIGKKFGIILKNYAGIVGGIILIGIGIKIFIQHLDVMQIFKVFK